MIHTIRLQEKPLIQFVTLYLVVCYCDHIDLTQFFVNLKSAS